VLLDGHGEVLYAGPNADYRGSVEAEELERLIGSRLYQATGQWIRPPAGVATRTMQTVVVQAS